MIRLSRSLLSLESERGVVSLTGRGERASDD